MSQQDEETLRVSREIASASTPSSSIDHGRFVPGALLGSRYRIVALLGKGGMGEVYRADDLLLGQPIALKFLPTRVSGNASALARLLGEVRIARQISHPNVCRVYDIGEVDGEHFISMEYVQGEDLRSLLHRIGHFGPEKGVQIARQICAGLAAAHDRGVLHRDLKPANVMIDERGVARITDFGLAVLADSAESRRREGTPAYMSPEQLDGGELTIQSDIYSLGLVLYEIFSGRMLFESKTITELLELRRSTTAKSVRLTTDTDPSIERVIQRCLAEDRAQRPKNASAVAAALPGGDPLAAAIAAGETPSPDLVAAAGAHQGVEPRYVVLAFAAILLLLSLVGFCKMRVDLPSVSGVHEPPDAMALRARDLLARLGYAQQPVDRAWSYRRTANGEGAYFWYRESAQAIVPVSFFRREVFAARSGSVAEGTPAPDRPGDVALRLDVDGRLIRLRVIPPPAQVQGPAFDWNVLLDAAQLDRGSLTPATPIATVAPFDHRAAWIMRDRKTGREQRIEAASLGGHPVSFEAIEPPPRVHISHGWMGLVWMVFILTLVGLMARANIRSGRSDFVGAVRTGLLAALSIFLTWLLGADHVTTTSEIGMLIEAMAWSAMVFVVLWAGYVAIEPTVRRRWPHSLVSWTRILRGQWKDPLVGRDILAGIIAGCILEAAGFGLPLLMSIVRSTRLVPLDGAEFVMLNGTSQAIGELLSVIPRSILDSMAQLLVVIVVWILTKRLWLAAGLFWLASTFLFLVGSPNIALAIESLIYVVLLVYLPRRFGYLALFVAMTTSAMLTITPVLHPFPSWHTGVSLLTVGIVVALAIFSGVVSLGGRRLLDVDFS